ncbi:MAG: EF-P lysine aminoacylase GenX [Nitrospinae bacterium]|nr:EF-P lysine aminoacylase GenX [Nitrospinota bacterium]
MPSQVLLQKRFCVLKNIRDFFYSRNYLEVDSPLMVSSPGTEHHIDAVKASGKNFKEKHLITSPEFSLKKYISKGFERIFQLSSCFRDEQKTEYHSPEFTMLEWYSTGESLDDLIECVKAFIIEVTKKTNKTSIINHQGRTVDVENDWQVLSIPQLFQENLSIPLTPNYPLNKLQKDVLRLGLTVSDDDDWDDLFFKIFLSEIEPKITPNNITIFKDYPPSQAALAKIGKNGWAERFELYIDTVELANAFNELTDSIEQRKRFEEVNSYRKKREKEIYPIDEELLDVLDQMPQTSGIALGVDRFIMLLLGKNSIQEIRMG